VPDVLCDTDVFVDHLRGARKLPLDRFGLCYSLVTRAELFAGRDPRVDLRALLRLGAELPLDGAIAERGGEIRRDHRLALPDALIAATALEHGLALLTRNVRHFQPVAGLTLAAR
jgi:predicted nucleic acid-binding protein